MTSNGTLVSARWAYSPVLGCDEDARDCAVVGLVPDTIRQKIDFDVEGFVALEDIGR